MKQHQSRLVGFGSQNSPKRAQVPVTVYFRIFEIILLVLVISIIYLEVKNVVDSRIFEKKFLARDLALLMDSVTNARGNLIYNYQTPLATLSYFDFDLRNRQVVVDDEAWSYATNNNQHIQEPLAFHKPSWLILRKLGNTVTIAAEDPNKPLELNSLLLDCPGTRQELKEVIIDPGHGYNPVTQKGDNGLVGAFKDAKYKPVPESQLMLMIGTSLQQYIIQQFPRLGTEKISSTRSLNVEFINLPAVGPLPFLAEEAKDTKERLARISAHPDAIIVSLHAGKADPAQNVIKAFVNKDSGVETLRLACTLLNAIATKYPLHITGTAIIPVDLKQLSEDDPKQVLLAGRIAVQLELGNMNIEHNKLFENPRELAEAIAAGIQGYVS